VQQNAALVEQSAAAADNMAGQAQSLVSSVARFKLPGATEVPRPQPQKKAAAPRPQEAKKKPAMSAPALAFAAAEGDWKEI
jgi:hypothetical protein